MAGSYRACKTCSASTDRRPFQCIQIVEVIVFKPLGAIIFICDGHIYVFIKEKNAVGIMQELFR